MGFVRAAMVFASLYWAAARLGLMFATINNSASPVWPATGVAFATLLLFGGRFWPAIALGALIANLQSGVSFTTAGLMAVGNTFEGVIGAWMISRISRKDELFGIHTATAALIGGSLAATVLSASMGTAALLMAGTIKWGGAFSVWSTWWVGDVVGGLIVTPAILAWSQWSKSELLQWPRFVALLTCGAAFCSLLLLRESAAYFLFLIFPFLLACTVFLSEPYSKTVAVLTSIGCMMMTYAGHGAFHGATTNSNLIHLQLFLSAFAISALVLGDFKRHSFLTLQVSAILLSGWALSGALFVAFHQSDDESVKLKFNAIADDVEPFMTARAKLYFKALHGGAGLFAASKLVERDEWRAFFEQARFSEDLSGLRGLGVAVVVPQSDAANFLKAARSDGAPDFDYKAVPGNAPNNGDKYVITYLEPLSSNRPAIGLDIASEPKRKLAADRARDSGDSIISDSITLVQEEKGRPGFLAIYPVYTHGTAPQTIEERRKRIFGWVYAPVIAAEFFGVLDGESNFSGLSYEVVSADDPSALVSSATFGSDSKRLERRLNVTIAGHLFEIAVRPNAAFQTDVRSNSSWAAAAAELLTLMLAALVVSLQSLRNKATELADTATLELRVSQNGLKTLFDTLPVGVAVLNEKGQIKNVNRVLQTLLKLDDDKIAAGAYLSRKIVGANGIQLEPHEFPSARVRKCNKMLADMIVGVPNDNGTTIWLEVNGAPLHPNDGSCVLVMQDITERKQTEARLAHSSKFATLGEMAGGVAHEINNPLQILSGLAHRLKRVAQKAPVNAPLLISDAERVSATVDRIAKIVKGLRTFSRDGNNDPYLSTSLRQMVLETFSLCQERFKTGSIDLDLNTFSDLALECRATAISQVLLNLLNNAYDAVSPLAEKWVRLDVQLSGTGSVQLRVTDSGSGIPPAIAEKLMQPFFTTKDVGKGTGLGLSISRAIAQDHGGDLTLDQSGPNTCFVLELAIRHTGVSAKAAA